MGEPLLGGSKLFPKSNLSVYQAMTIGEGMDELQLVVEHTNRARNRGDQGIFANTPAAALTEIFWFRA